MPNIFVDLTSTFATKADLAELEADFADLKSEIAAMEARITWRIIGAMHEIEE